MNEEREQYKKVQLKKARMTAVVFGLLAVMTLSSMVYTFTQNTEARRQQDLVLQKVVKETITLREQLANCQSEKK